MKYRDLLDIADTVVCLSLEESYKRRALFESRWKDILLDKPFQYFISGRPTKESLDRRFNNFSGARIGKDKLTATDLGRWGCWLSHYDILSNCKARGKKSVLILEDDTYPNQELIDEDVNDVPFDWDVIYLGNSSFDMLAEYTSKPLITDQTIHDPSKRHRHGGWKKIRAWGTYAMIIRDSAFDLYMSELKDYAPRNGKVWSPPTADGTYYFYLWKKLSFYFNDHLVLHDYSLKSEITCKQAKREDYVAFKG